MDMKSFMEKNRNNNNARNIAWEIAQFLAVSSFKNPKASYDDFVVALSFTIDSFLKNDVDRENVRELLVASHAENTQILNDMEVI